MSEAIAVLVARYNGLSASSEIDRARKSIFDSGLRNPQVKLTFEELAILRQKLKCEPHIKKNLERRLLFQADSLNEFLYCERQFDYEPGSSFELRINRGIANSCKDKSDWENVFLGLKHYDPQYRLASLAKAEIISTSIVAAIKDLGKILCRCTQECVNEIASLKQVMSEQSELLSGLGDHLQNLGDSSQAMLESLGIQADQGNKVIDLFAGAGMLLQEIGDSIDLHGMQNDKVLEKLDGRASSIIGNIDRMTSALEDIDYQIKVSPNSIDPYRFSNTIKEIESSTKAIYEIARK